ncbi:MDR family MFS transporter [Ancylobacter terrae]|uniref:MDR family MFS transporter n=1 Tax=Ancylobacter sp. sgz301288 TaxID=3342077 RepID=UPI00385A0149
MDARTAGGGTDSRPTLSHTEIRTIVVGIMLAMFLSALDQTIVATALPTIGIAFNDVANLSWVVTAYLLTATAVTPLAGKLADIHGPRPVLLVCIAVFLIGSAACALAPSMLGLILARGLQGVGGGGLISLAQTIIGLLVAPRERGRYQGYFAAVFISSSIAGPVLGGFFAQHLHWSLIFWINVPLGLLAAGMSNHVLKRLPPHGHRHRLDIEGALLMCAATAALMLALSWGGNRFAWGSLPILGLIAASVVLWVGFGLRISTAIEPLLPLSVLGNQVVRTGVTAAAFAMGTLIGLSITVPLYLEAILRFSATQSGLAMIPMMTGVVCGATLAGRLMGRIVNYKRIPYIGLSFGIAALIVLTIQPSGLPIAVMIPLTGVAGMGLGTVLPVTTVAIQNAVPVVQLGTATAAMNFFRSLGGAVLTAGFGAIVVGIAGAKVGHGEVLATLVEGSDALVGAFRWVFAAAAMSLAASLVAVILMEQRPFRATVGHAPPVE